MRRTGMLRIAALPAVSNGFLPHFAGRFLADRPNLNLSFFGVISPLVIDGVVYLQCDIGFAEVPIAHAGLPIIRMPALPRVAVIPAGHRLCAKAMLRPADFEGETFISLTAGSTGRHLIDSVFDKHDVSRLLRVETSLSEIMCGMVSSGLGVAICDPFTAAEFASRGVVARPFLPRVPFEFAAVFPPQRTPSPVAQEFVEIFADEVRTLAAGLRGRRPI